LRTPLLLTTNHPSHMQGQHNTPEAVCIAIKLGQPRVDSYPPALSDIMRAYAVKPSSTIRLGSGGKLPGVRVDLHVHARNKTTREASHALERCETRCATWFGARQWRRCVRFGCLTSGRPSPHPLDSPTSTRSARPPHAELMPSACSRARQSDSQHSSGAGH